MPLHAGNSAEGGAGGFEGGRHQKAGRRRRRSKSQARQHQQGHAQDTRSTREALLVVWEWQRYERGVGRGTEKCVGPARSYCT